MNIEVNSEYLTLLKNRIDLRQIPFSERGSRLLIFRSNQHLTFRLAERWFKREGQLSAYRRRPPLIDEWIFADGEGDFDFRGILRINAQLLHAARLVEAVEGQVDDGWAQTEILRDLVAGAGPVGELLVDDFVASDGLGGAGPSPAGVLSRHEALPFFSVDRLIVLCAIGGEYARCPLPGDLAKGHRGACWRMG